MADFQVTPVDHDPFAGEAEGDGAPAAAPQGSFLDALGAAFGSDMSRLGNSLTSAVTAPQRALQGDFNQLEVSPSGRVTSFDPRLLSEAANMTSVVPLGAAIPKPENSLGIFGGQMARTADMDSLAAAKNLEYTLTNPDTNKVSEVSRGKIFSQTGWFRGSDQKWRFEIPDTGVEMDLSRLSPGDRPVPLDTVVNHPKLFSAYPNLRDAGVRAVNSKDFLGQYDPSGGGETIEMAHDIGSVSRQPLTTMLHELQHGVQQREGFAYGAGPGDAEINSTYDSKILPRAEKIIADTSASWEKWKEQADPAGVADPDVLFHKYLTADPDSLARPYRQALLIKNRLVTQGPNNAPYMSVAGEVEARNVENRYGRANALMPWQTEDTPGWAQIVRLPK